MPLITSFYIHQLSTQVHWTLDSDKQSKQQFGIELHQPSVLSAPLSLHFTSFHFSFFVFIKKHRTHKDELKPKPLLKLSPEIILAMHLMSRDSKDKGSS